MALKNKFHIENQIELARVEEKISKQKAISLWSGKFFEEMPAGSFETLAAIHKNLFEEIYYFAGKLRDENISNGNFRFASALYLFDAVKNIEKMPQKNFYEIVEKYVEMNVAHPFREGNGRSMRIWLDHIFKTELKKVVDWSQIVEHSHRLRGGDSCKVWQFVLPLFAKAKPNSPHTVARRFPLTFNFLA